MDQLNKRAYEEFDNMVQLKRYYGSTKTPDFKGRNQIDYTKLEHRETLNIF
jgi:hypothetical protein